MSDRDYPRVVLAFAKNLRLVDTGPGKMENSVRTKIEIRGVEDAMGIARWNPYVLGEDDKADQQVFMALSEELRRALA